MASYVERVLDFMERVTKIPEIEKQIREDLEWAIETISTNKLYSSGLEGFDQLIQNSNSKGSGNTDS